MITNRLRNILFNLRYNLVRHCRTYWNNRRRKFPAIEDFIRSPVIDDRTAADRCSMISNGPSVLGAAEITMFAFFFSFLPLPICICTRIFNTLLDSEVVYI